MNLLAAIATCLTLTNPTTECIEIQETYQHQVGQLAISERERDAISRVAYAEAANQGDDGLAAVVYTIINRLISGEFGNTVDEVLNAKNQFEPVTRAGGSWQKLPKASPVAQAKVDTILNLAIKGVLPDLTRGSLYFQNPTIVAQREKEGKVSKGLTHFGGSTPTVVINDHAFYQQANFSKKKSEAVTLKKSFATRKARLAEEKKRFHTQYQSNWTIPTYAKTTDNEHF